MITERVNLGGDDVVNLFRLGEKKDDKVRPLLAKMKSDKFKWDIVKASKDLKYQTDGTRHSVVITWDKS